MSRRKTHRVKVPKVKIRKTWTRHPAEKVVNNKRERRPISRKLKEEATSEYEDTK